MTPGGKQRFDFLNCIHYYFQPLPSTRKASYIASRGVSQKAQGHDSLTEKVVARVTIMVNNRNSYCCREPNLPDPPSGDDPDIEDRAIKNGPIWDLKELVQIATRTSADDAVHVLTTRAETDLEALEETGFNLQEVMMLLPSKGKFKGSAWCKSSPATDRFGKPRGKGFWFPCDAYTVVGSTIHPVTGYSSTAEYYLKMAKGLNGTFVVFVSIHISN